MSLDILVFVLYSSIVYYNVYVMLPIIQGTRYGTEKPDQSVNPSINQSISNINIKMRWE